MAGSESPLSGVGAEMRPKREAEGDASRSTVPETQQRARPHDCEPIKTLKTPTLPSLPCSSTPSLRVEAPISGAHAATYPLQICDPFDSPRTTTVLNLSPTSECARTTERSALPDASRSRKSVKQRVAVTALPSPLTAQGVRKQALAVSMCFIPVCSSF